MRLWIALIAASCAAQTPSVERVLARYVEALGGREALLAVKSRVAVGSVVSPTFGTWGEYAEQSRRPNLLARGYRMERYGVVQRVFDGARGWYESPEYAVETLGGARLAELRREAEFDAPLKLGELYPSLQVLGRVRMFDQDLTELVSKLPEGGEARLLFSEATGLLAAVIAPETARSGTSRPVETWYEDYREVQGVKLAHTVRMASDELIVIVKRTFLPGHPIDETRFRKPQ